MINRRQTMSHYFTIEELNLVLNEQEDKDE